MTSHDEILFSIIVPAYQVEIYIEECIASVEVQDFSAYEIIIVNDGSTDNTPNICNELAKKNTRIKVIHQKNKGLSEARNAGLHCASGKYCIFLDSDDLLAPNSLETLAIDIVENGNPDIMVCNVATYLDGEVINYIDLGNASQFHELSTAKKYDFLQHLSGFYLGAWVFCVKRQYIIEKNLYFYQGIFHEDEEWVPRTFFQTSSIEMHNSIFYYYRVGRTGSITSVPNVQRMFDKLLIIDLIMQEFSKETYSFEIRKIMELRRQAILFGIMNNLYLYCDNQRYDELKVAMESKAYILENSNRRLYRLYYKVGNMVGFCRIGQFFTFLYGLKKKIFCKGIACRKVY